MYFHILGPRGPGPGPAQGGPGARARPRARGSWGDTWGGGGAAPGPGPCPGPGPGPWAQKCEKNMKIIWNKYENHVIWHFHMMITLISYYFHIFPHIFFIFSWNPGIGRLCIRCLLQLEKKSNKCFSGNVFAWWANCSHTPWEYFACY